MKKQILNPSHKFWRALCIRLNDMLNSHVDGTLRFRCHHDLRNTEKILKSLPNIDVEKTLEFYRDLGGYCDCEILMNVELTWNGK